MVKLQSGGCSLSVPSAGRAPPQRFCVLCVDEGLDNVQSMFALNAECRAEGHLLSYLYDALSNCAL
jgi:hypothetical protein